MAEAPSFVSRVRPVIISVASLAAEFDSKEFWALADAGPLDRGVTARYELSHVGKGVFNIAATYEFLMGDLRLNAAPTETVSEINAPVSVTCRYVGHFHVDGEFSRDAAQRFTDSNAWVIFWPFFRQLVSDSTARMSIPPEILPLGLGPGRYAMQGTERREPEKQKAAKKKKAVKPKKA